MRCACLDLGQGEQQVGPRLVLLVLKRAAPGGGGEEPRAEGRSACVSVCGGRGQEGEDVSGGGVVCGG